jgi:hypothetical protein
MLGMGTFGGRRAVAHAVARLVPPLVPPLMLASVLAVPLLAGCSAALDQAHSVQTRLGRLEEVAGVEVTTPSADAGAAIRLDYTGATTGRELSRLIDAIDRVATDERYPSYRLELTSSDTDRLVVDDGFVGSRAEPAVLENWLAVTSVLLGEVDYIYEAGHEAIVVDAGAGIAHDVGEASRIRYGTDDTTWTFRDDGTTFVASGRVSAADVLLFQGVQRTVSSEVLPAPARTWRLERYDDHLLLDLHVTVPGRDVTAEQLTVRRYGADVRRLVVAALGQLDVGLPVWVRLHHVTAAGDDLFGYWVSDQRPVRGRDRLVRGWDLWLVEVARTAVS